jgi:nucleotide-binding universal stress UspA family protein
MQCILVPFDGSRPAKRAVEHAIRLAKSRRLVLHVLNVEPELDDYGMVRAYLTRSKHHKSMMERGRTLLEPAERRCKDARVRHKSHVACGEPAGAIVRMARRLKCESIVMGTRGLGAVGSVLLGSVAARTIHLSPVPVTLVR